MTATVHVKIFLCCCHRLQNTSSQVKTRGSNFWFFEENLSYKSINSSSEIIRDGLTLVCLHQCNDLHLVHKPHSQSRMARPAMPFVNQERLVLKFTNVLSPTVTKHVPLVRNISIHLYLYLYTCINFLFLFQVRSMFTMKKKE